MANANKMLTASMVGMTVPPSLSLSLLINSQPVLSASPRIEAPFVRQGGDF